MKEATYGCLSRVNPKFCVNAKLWCKIEQNNFKAGAAQAAARLVYKITALRGDAKGGGASLRPWHPGVQSVNPHKSEFFCVITVTDFTCG